MFKMTARVTGHEAVGGFLDSIAGLRNYNTRHLVRGLKRIVEQEHDRMARQGVGTDGSKLPPPAPSTDARNRRRYGRTTGIPLHPRGLASRTATGRNVVVYGGNGIVHIDTNWSGAPWVVLHASGRGARGIIRDIMLLDRPGIDRVRNYILDAILSDLKSGRHRTTRRGKR